MPGKWIPNKEKRYRKELWRLYVLENKTIREIGKILGIAQQTVFQRMQRLGIPSDPRRKINYLGKRSDVRIPIRYTDELAEFFGIMLGDGHLSHFQIVVTLGTKEDRYAKYVAELIQKIFGATPRIGIRKKGYKDVYLGCVDLTKWLFQEGLVLNKVKSQVKVPEWLFSSSTFSKRFIRGFFDTDGSVYKLRYGIQIAFSNRSLPLLISLRSMLIDLKYKPSHIVSI